MSIITSGINHYEQEEIIQLFINKESSSPLHAVESERLRGIGMTGMDKLCLEMQRWKREVGKMYRQ